VSEEKLAAQELREPVHHGRGSGTGPRLIGNVEKRRSEIFETFPVDSGDSRYSAW